MVGIRTAKIVITKSRNWYKEGDTYEVTYSPKHEVYKTEDGRMIEPMHVRASR